MHAVTRLLCTQTWTPLDGRIQLLQAVHFGSSADLQALDHLVYNVEFDTPPFLAVYTNVCCCVAGRREGGAAEVAVQRTGCPAAGRGGGSRGCQRAVPPAAGACVRCAALPRLLVACRLAHCFASLAAVQHSFEMQRSQQ